MTYPQVESLNAYQERACSTLVCPPGYRKCYLPLQLAAEAGEVASKIAKPMRDGTDVDTDALKKELGDVLWYVSVLAAHFGISLEDVANTNINKLADRKARGALGGSGDNR